MSADMARIILRKFSACSASRPPKVIRLIFVSPSTRKATSLPKASSICWGVARVSSTVSWSSPVTTVEQSSRMSASIPATSIGWMRYGSPDRRTCPWWTLAEKT